MYTENQLTDFYMFDIGKESVNTEKTNLLFSVSDFKYVINIV